MKLWEAMLKGSKLRPQVFGATHNEFGTCAMGAAFEGAGIPFSENPILRVVFPESGPIQDSSCPVCELGSIYRNNRGLIPHLNDDHNWSRECIAYYIRDTFEKKDTKTEEVFHEILV
jgi:hypothetical protein